MAGRSADGCVDGDVDVNLRLGEEAGRDHHGSRQPASEGEGH